MKNIALIGMPGSGKTIIGSVLANKLKISFHDLDALIERKTGQIIRDIFNQHGEDYFRDIETELLAQLCENEGILISTGGGVITREQNVSILRDKAIIIFIDRPLENIVKDIDASNRPLLSGGIQRLYELYSERYPLYTEACHVRIENDGELKYSVEKIGDYLENIGYKRT